MNEDTKRHLTELICCALEEKVPELSCDSIDFKQLYINSRNHGVCALIYTSLLKIDGIDQKLLVPFKEVYSKQKQFTVLLDYYSEMVSTLLRQHGIRFALVKGQNLRKLYPDPISRFSCDIDILCDGKEEYKKALDLLISDGYKRICDHGKDVELRKDNITFEIHYALFQGHDAYFSDVFSRCTKRDGSQYFLNDEDVYIYCLKHSHSHFFSGVVTIRSICDIYLIRKYCQSIDYSYTDKIISQYGLDKYQSVILGIIDKWWKGMPQPREIEFVENYIFNLSFENLTGKKVVRNNIVSGKKKSGKVKFLFFINRLFPSYSFMKIRYKFLEKYKLLYPFTVIFRPFHTLFKGGFARIRNEIYEVKSISKSEISELAEVKDIIGSVRN